MGDNLSQSERIQKAISLVRSGRSKEAIPILTEIIADDPTCLVAHRERGFANRSIGDFDGAIVDFTQMMCLAPSDPHGLTLRADVHRLAGQIGKAIDDYSAAIAIDPEHPYAYFHRGRAKAESDDLVGAIADCTIAKDYDRMGPHGALLNRGAARYRLGDLPGALADLTEALRCSTYLDAHTLLLRGRVRSTAGDYQGAIADFTMALSAFPQLSNAFRERAAARQAIGDTDGAAADLAQYELLGGKDLPAYL